MSEPELVADYECVVGEGPVWHPDEERLYWVDIPNGRLLRYDPATGDHGVAHETDVIGGLTLQEDGSFLLFEDAGRIERLDGGETETVVEEIPAERDTRFNDVIADPGGRVFCGTMPGEDHLGRLYRLDTDGSLTTLVEGVDIANGMGFTHDRRRMYFTESNAFRIYRYAYDEATGELADRETFVDVSGEAGIPDGMTVDAEGHVWSARWDGGCVVRYDPDGREVRRVDLPARKVSSVAFGGPDYDELYVTTALGEDPGASREAEGDGAGALFRLDPGVRGRPEFRSAVDV